MPGLLERLFAGSRPQRDYLRGMTPAGAAPAAPPPVDLDGLGSFLGEVDRVLQALDQPGAPRSGPTSSRNR